MGKLKLPHQQYVQGTLKKQLVPLLDIRIGRIPQALRNMPSPSGNAVYLSTRVLKHVYDKRTAQEFDFLLAGLPKIIASPDRMYRNKLGKREGYCLVRTHDNFFSFCLLERKVFSSRPRWEVVTFYVTDERYLAGYELVWERKDDESSS